MAGATRTLAAMNPVAVSGSTVTLTLSSAARYGETVTLDYAVPTSNPVQDSAGNDAAALTDQDVANDTAAPGVSVAATSATEGTDLVFTVTLSEASGRVAAIQYTVVGGHVKVKKCGRPSTAVSGVSVWSGVASG